MTDEQIVNIGYWLALLVVAVPLSWWAVRKKKWWVVVLVVACALALLVKGA